MGHRAWRNRVLGYHEGDLPRAERAALELHLESCAACRRLLASLQEMDTLLRGSRPVAEVLPPAVSGAVLAEALSRAGVSRVSRRRPWGIWSFAASLGCLLAASTARIEGGGGRAVVERPVPAPGAVVAKRIEPEPGAPPPAEVRDAVPTADRKVTRRRAPRRARFRRERPQAVVAKAPVRPEAAVSVGAESGAVIPAPEPASEPAHLLLVLHEAPRLEIEVEELPEEAPGLACASSAVQDAHGRVTQKEVRVSSHDPEPQVVLTGLGGEPIPTN